MSPFERSGCEVLERIVGRGSGGVFGSSVYTSYLWPKSTTPSSPSYPCSLGDFTFEGGFVKRPTLRPLWTLEACFCASIRQDDEYLTMHIYAHVYEVD